MDLKDFIAETIIQITEGIEEAKNKTRQYGTVINPPCVATQEHIRVNSDPAYYNPQPAQFIEFDISVSVEYSNNTELKGKIGIAPFSIGGDKSKINTNENISRLKFSIPVVFPQEKI